MKTIITTCIALLCITTYYAQETTTAAESSNRKVASSRDAKRKFVFGLKAGVNRSNVYDEKGMNFVADPKTGFAGGIFAALPLGGFLGVQPEVLISQKGFSGSGTIDNENYSINRTTTFLDIPLQAQIKPFRFLSVLAGVQYSYLLNQNDEFIFGSNSVTQSQEFKNDNIRKNIFGGTFGLDVNIRHIVISGKIAWDLQTNNGDGSSYTPRYKNVWLQTTVGYRFY